MGVDRETFRSILSPLCTMFRVSFDVAQWTVYYEALTDVSEVLLRSAVVLASRDGREFMPRPGELRAYAEQDRLARLAAQPWKPCIECLDAKGFVEVVDGNGVKRLAPCGCRAMYRQQLAAAGVPSRSLLEAPREEGDEGATWASGSRPDPASLPPALQQQVRELATAHDMSRSFSRESRHKRLQSADLTPQTDLEGRPLPPWPYQRKA